MHSTRHPALPQELPAEFLREHLPGNTAAKDEDNATSYDGRTWLSRRGDTSATSICPARHAADGRAPRIAVARRASGAGRHSEGAPNGVVHDGHR